MSGLGICVADAVGLPTGEVPALDMSGPDEAGFRKLGGQFSIFLSVPLHAVIQISCRSHWKSFTISISYGSLP